ncbi:L10-interacting MYB domain-containing protein-like [Humulus lupulus]|uniref:L10-interacting MYB domain-containing protein-like n=1 Tax=Humulus lupulus TaxID=3486 RepID=UPI002B40B34F|nr:L10-interacting MYB domain-containing protein-like [Humulus lupulus]
MKFLLGIDNEVLIIENNDETSIWTQRHEEIFIELMEEEVLKGNKNTTTFTKQSWKYIKEELCARAKRNYSDMQLRNKYNQLKQKHKDFKSLLKETGMGYNAVTGEVSATDEVCDKLIRSAKRFRKKCCKFYEKLCTIFSDTTATGANAHPSIRSPSNDGDTNDDDATSISPSTRNEESGFDEDGSKRRGKSTATSNSRLVKRAKFSSALADALATHNETAKRKTELIERSMATSASHYLLDESVEALNQIDGISGEVYAKAIEKFENEDKISFNVARFNKDNLLDDSDDEFGEIFLYFACEEYNQLYISKQPCRNSNCVGAIDGTHISAHVPIDEQIPYRGRNVDTTQNIMCVCSFDMKFTCIVPGWEGSVNVARILLECATNPDYEFPMPPQEKYYLVDSGYTNMPGFLSPYQGERTNAEAGVYFDGGEGNYEIQVTTLQSTDGTLTDSVEFSISRTHIREMAHVRDEIADHIWRSS